ncbi:hypothetical protein WN55_07762 [Dufourea novaeangliae]|uniref:Uncharacterized protein n=1 Tax=Dufourea novaeangliae TaxID=178035 RepID=A0A154P4L4_DUFNO|nr:hypothetical protein WN55_07762 [Dufourea novaeangliae]
MSSRKTTSGCAHRATIRSLGDQTTCRGADPPSTSTARWQAQSSLLGKSKPYLNGSKNKKETQE